MNRRTFLTYAGLSPLVLRSQKSQLQLCYNTLACPDWSWEQIVSSAQLYGYQGVEIRGIGGELNLCKHPEFAGEAWRSALRLAKEKGISIVNLNTSAHLHESSSAANEVQMRELRAYIGLAQKLGCPFVRVFPEKFAIPEDKIASMQIMIKNLRSILSYAKGTGMRVLLDAHGDLSHSEDIAYMMQNIPQQQSGIIWDYYNMHLQSGESAEAMFKSLRKYIRIVQIKDGVFAEGKHTYTLPGKGEVPIKTILELIKKSHYQGFVSFEWEKRWHPELPEPEIALPAFVELVRGMRL